jgi:hypothetical protein
MFGGDGDLAAGAQEALLQAVRSGLGVTGQALASQVAPASTERTT